MHALNHSEGDSDLASGHRLPIERDSWKIRTAIREHTVVAIKAETASGKKMKGPQYLRQEVNSWPVLIVQKSCFAAELVVNSLVSWRHLTWTGAICTGAQVFTMPMHSVMRPGILSLPMVFYGNGYELSWISIAKVRI